MSQTEEAATQSTAPKRKRPRGRPPSPETKKNKEQVWFRCESQDKLDFRREAKRMGVPLRTWIKLTLKAAVASAKAARKDAA